MTDLTQGSLGYQTTHPLVARITRLRGRVRTILALYGAGLLVTSVLSVLLVLVLADYLFHLPVALRIGLLIATIVGLGILAWRRLILPLSTRLTDKFLASRIENLNPELADELISAVAFIHSRAGLTNALAARHIDLAAQRTAGINFENSVNFQRAAKSVGIAGLAMVVVTILAIANPALAGIGLSRLFLGSAIAWPHSNHVTFIWTDSDGNQTTRPPRVRPLGEKLIVRAKVDQGARPRVWLTSWTDKSGADKQLMTFQKEQSTSSEFFFESSLEPEGRQLWLRVVAGDDTEEEVVNIGLAPRPVITDMQAMILAPVYARDVKDPSKPASPTLVNLQVQTGRATLGSTIKLALKSTKSFKTNSKGEPEVAFFDQNTSAPLFMPMSRRLVSSNEAEVSFIAEKTLQARIQMIDTDDFASRGGGTATIEVVPDAMPAVVVTDPRRSVERAPNGIVEMTVQATDDWGFRGLMLRADRFDAKDGDPAAFETDLKWQELLADAAVGSTTGKTQYTWDLTPLNLQPGTRLTFYSKVQDNYDLDGKTHDWVKSSPLSLQIRSTNDIQEIQRKALSELNDRLRSLRAQQELTRSQTEAIRRNVATSGQMSDEQRQQLASLTQQQTQESASANAIQQRAEQIAQELKQNKIQEGELGKIAQAVAQGMTDVGQQNMPRAAANLNQAQEAKGGQNNPSASQPAGTQTSSSQPAGTPASGNPASQNAAQQASQAMAGATQQQEQAITKMDDLIKRLAATGDFESLKQETAKLLQQQQDLTRQTQQLAPRLMGNSRDSLPQDLKNQEDKIAAQQKELGEKTADLINRMEGASQPLSQSDPASAQSLSKAAESGKSNAVSTKQQDAARNLTGVPGDSKNNPGNQVNDAQNNQQAAQQGLQQMMAQLEQNDLRKLEQLARDIRKLLDDVQKLRDDQAAIGKDTDAAGPAVAAAPIRKLADKQGTLQQNTIIIQKKAENTQEAGQAAAFIGEAADHMGSASAALFGSKQPDALKPQADALTALDQALAELKKAAAAVEPKVKDKQLAEYIRQYEAMKKDQVAIKQTADALEAKRLAAIDLELELRDEQKVGGLAITQGGLVDQINALSKDERLAEVAVVVWMNGEVADSMTTSKARMEKLQLGKQTAFAQQSAIDKLDLIINALKEEQQKPPEFKNDPAGGGGGGGGGGQKPPLVPPVAQLKMLKAMQVVVNGQTKSIDTDLRAAASDADRNIYQTQAQELGGKESKIRGMASQIVDQLLQNQQRPPAATGPGGAATQPGPR